jgi:uncharacterized surface protein with fasciclin (FAS1) repeats
MTPPLPLRRTLLALGTFLALATGCATTTEPANIADTAARTPSLSTLSRLINEAGLAETLRGPGPYTVFAPSDEAFKAVPAKTMDELGKNKDLLKSVLAYHILPGKVASADVRNGNAKTVQGADVALAKSGSFVTVEDAMVVQSDVAATNGVVHVIDRVLVPAKR